MFSSLIKKVFGGELIAEVRGVLAFMKRCGVRMRFFARSLAFSFGLTLFSLYTVSLLFPLVNGIISGNWTAVKGMPLINVIVGRYPAFFSTNMRLFLFLIAWIYATIIIKNALQYAAFLSTTRQAKQAIGTLSDILLEKCLSFGKGFYDQTKISVVHDTLTRSTLAVESQFRALQSFIIDMLLFVMYLCIMFFISWKLTILALVIFPLTGIGTRSIVRKVRALIKSADTAYAAVSERISLILNAMFLIKGFGTEEAELALFREASEREIRESFRIQKLQNLIGPIEDIGATTATLVLGCGMAFMLYLDHTLTASTAFIFFYLATRLNASFAAVTSFRISLANSSVALGKITDLLDNNGHFISERGRLPFSQLLRAIEIRNLSFSYSGAGGPVLKNISVTIEKGKTTAIVGPTGSGKSTVAHLLLGFYDAAPGTILIDGIDILTYDPPSVRKKMSFVSQDIFLFNTTIDHNMRYASNANVNPREFAEVSAKTAVHEFVSRLPDGYGTKVGDRGTTLSGGEKQRIALARAILRDADVFILDEATSSLDPLTEQAVNAAITEYGRGKTFIVISHRLAAIRNADHVVYIDRGEITERGSVNELLSRKGAFYKQWQAQGTEKTN